MKVVGYEGSSSPYNGFTYGAAALDDGTQIVNAITRFTCSYEQYKELVDDNTVRPIPEICVNKRESEFPLVVVYVDHKCLFESGLNGFLYQNSLGCRWDNPDRDHFFLIRSIDIVDELVTALVPRWETFLIGDNAREVAGLILTIDPRNKAALKTILPNINWDNLRGA